MLKTSLCLYNDDIKKYTDKDVKDLSVGDEVTLTLKCKVKEVSSREEENYSVNLDKEEKKEEKKELVRRVDFEVVSSDNKQSSPFGKQISGRL